jgi:Cu(I)/Ag(I) efflux system membrane fusion protein
LRAFLGNSKVEFRPLIVKIGIFAVAILGFLAGYAVRNAVTVKHPGSAGPQQSTAQLWTCSMHPDVKQPKPGKCPLCFMDLVPVATGADDLGERQISFSPGALKLMEVQTSVVERKFVETQTRMVGKVDYNETRVKHITAWVKGRIDRLYVDFTGTRVAKGDHMVYLYSSELLEDQKALLAGIEAAKKMPAGGSDLAGKFRLANIEAVRERLRLKGLNDKQIADIEKTGRPVDHITIYAPIGGVVIEKHRTEGTYVDIGTEIYTIADLSSLWVKLDAYESDLPWIRYGQQVEFETEAYPGDIFKGTISFIDPVLNPRTRTVKLRVNVDNSDGRLKPEMFVRAVVRSRVARAGKVMTPEMAGKWICPMHPSIVKTEAADCDICGMDLVTTEKFGFVPVDTSMEPPLVIPASAPLITGTRAVVYVRLPQKTKPTFEGREIVLGPRAGDYYIVKSGLTEGEIIVTNGNFKIDSALQIQAKPSMMSADHEKAGGEPQAVKVSEQFRGQVAQVIEGYFKLQTALAADKAGEASMSADQISKSLAAVDMTSLSDKAHQIWMHANGEMTKALAGIKQAGDIEPMRIAFKTLSDELIELLGRLQLVDSDPVYKFHCPMAFNNTGADWLQADRDTRNPYFGASMLKCGWITETIVKQRE